MEIRIIEQNESEWESVLSHLKRTNHIRWITKNGVLEKDVSVIAAVISVNEVIGHISLLKRKILIPSLPVEELKDGSGTILYENFVMTFFVEEPFRRRGIGESLQKKAIELTREMGLFQLRSWSSNDKTENYILKLKLGFAFNPGHCYVEETGQYIPGGYFTINTKNDWEEKCLRKKKLKKSRGNSTPKI